MSDHKQHFPTIQKLNLLDQVRASNRTKHNNPSTNESYINWIKIFVLFLLTREIALYFFLFIDFLLHVVTKGKIQKFAISHGAGKKHPRVIGEKEINEFFKSTTVFAHILNHGGQGVRSPDDTI